MSKDWYEAADEFVTALEVEAKDPKPFYGCPSFPDADGRERVRGGIANLKNLTVRLEAINRG